MKPDDKLLNALFALLRCEMWQEPAPALDLTPDEYAQVYQEACHQTVAGMVANVFIRHNIAVGKELAVKCYYQLKEIRQENAYFNKQLASFIRFMNRHDLRYAIVKGQVVGQDYPDPGVRGCGDVDIYCDSEYYPKTKETLEKRILKRQLANDSTNKHVEFDVSGITYELHSMLSEFAHKPYRDYLNRIVEEDFRSGMVMVDVDGTEVSTLSPTMNALYLPVHIYYHLIINGVGLRQLCDWALFMHRHHAEVDKAKLDEYLTNLGMKKAIMALGAVVVETLKLPAAEFPFELTQKDFRRGRRILKNMIKMGNFGHSAHKVKELGILHSMETGWITLKQCLRFYSLCPPESRGRFPLLFKTFLRRHAKEE